MRLVRILLLSHLAALVFGLIGLLVMLPNPRLWSGSPLGVQVFTLGMQYAGALHILLGALTMLVFGGTVIGWRKTLIFFVVSVAISLGSELIGTATGWPFGNYAYTDGLGVKVLGRVPYTIPLSWFYMGFASYLLATLVLTRLTSGAWVGPRWRAWLTVILGAWLLLAWDLVLDPAMAHESLPMKFWVWHETGAYFGMPVRNLGAWFLTGLVYIGVSRLLWREDIGDSASLLNVPLVTYLANVAFAGVMSASVGLWQPIPLAIAFAVAPVALVFWVAGGRTPQLEASGLAKP